VLLVQHDAAGPRFMVRQAGLLVQAVKLRNPSPLFPLFPVPIRSIGWERVAKTREAAYFYGGQFVLTRNCRSTLRDRELPSPFDPSPVRPVRRGNVFWGVVPRVADAI
jgi:hypothetical protein